MDDSWRYRLSSFFGTALVTVAAVVVTNLRVVHEAFGRVPFFGNPAPEVLPASEVQFAIMTTLFVILFTMWPLFKPQPRRILDTILLAQKRIFLAMVGLAAIGYFKYSYRLPRTTLMLTTIALAIALPPFMIAIRRRPRSSSRAVIIGDDPQAMESLLTATDLPVLGYVSPPSVYAPDGIESRTIELPDGENVEDDLDMLPCLGGIARLEDVFVENDVDTALLAFAATDREEFFGTLEACYDNGVNALVHRDHADHVLTDDFSGERLLDVDLEPWDWQDYIVKRLFDVVFVGTAFVVLSPVIALIGVAIKLDDGGPLLYRQERTAVFGRTFTVRKFRSMVSATEDTLPDSEEKQRITRVGSVLRKTHLDEIPQLWAILAGDMSVVGPRAVWTDEEVHLENKTTAWRKRWFIKPGLTGLAQINNATSAEAEDKLRYDLQYIRQQSFWFDIKIVVRQLWQVGGEMFDFASSQQKSNSTEPSQQTTNESTQASSNETDQYADSPTESSQKHGEDAETVTGEQP
ncbi:sugar transferase [Halovenus rubra]|uniref:Sugar transferase n=2 Tax=Halovenus rubra TaxID=869890 RepID=A0ACC7DW88_9EURY|nr:sugar transferase [Halovenus rubra]